MVRLTERERKVLLLIVLDTNRREDTIGCLMRYHRELGGQSGVLELARKLEAREI